MKRWLLSDAGRAVARAAGRDRNRPAAADAGRSAAGRRRRAAWPDRARRDAGWSSAQAGDDRVGGGQRAAGQLVAAVEQRLPRRGAASSASGSVAAPPRRVGAPAARVRRPARTASSEGDQEGGRDRDQPGEEADPADDDARGDERGEDQAGEDQARAPHPAASPPRTCAAQPALLRLARARASRWLRRRKSSVS